MENPATWSDDAKAIDRAIREYEEQVAQGIIGHSLVRVIEDAVLVPLRKSRFEAESGKTHWEGCWRDHYRCAMRRIEELEERSRMEADIALSAICLKLNIEHGFPPRLDALNRDLAAFQSRFGGVVEVVGKAAVAMDEGANGKRD
jgi:hypothetical protein